MTFLTLTGIKRFQRKLKCEIIVYASNVGIKNNNQLLVNDLDTIYRLKINLFTTLQHEWDETPVSIKFDFTEQTL